MSGDAEYAKKFTALTKGSLEAIMSGRDIDKPVFQILGTKRIGSSSPDASERYRMLVSDGNCFHSFAMLATQLNPMYINGELPDYTIIRLNRYITSAVNQNSGKGEKRVLIMLELEVLHPGDQVAVKLFEPVQYVPPKENAAPNTTSQAAKPAINKNPSVSNGSEYNSRPQNQPQKRNNDTMNSTMNQSLSDALTHPISSLSPYQNKWVIKVRCTAKSGVRTWSNAKGEGKLFSMDFMDETGEIRATAFRDQVDKYYDMIEVDKVYYVSKCTLKPANKQYSQIKNDYEMTFNPDTVIQECMDEVSSIPQMSYDLIPISSIAEREPNNIVDVLGVVKEAADLMTLTARTTGRELTKREITLVDQSNAAINLTLWGEEAKNFDHFGHPVLLVKGARITEFGGGKSLGMISGTVIKTNPDIPEGHRLRGWYENGGSDNVVSSVSARAGGAGGMTTEWVTFAEARERNLGNGDKADYFQSRGYIHNIRNTNVVYKACPTPECNKKVVDQDNGQYRCEKCNADFNNFKYRLMCSALIGDWTGNRWCTMFSELSESVLGKTAQEVGEAIEMDNAEKIFQDCNFKSMVFKFRTKVEVYGDVPRNKTTVIAANKINYKEYNAMLMKRIQDISGIGKNPS